jgi:hypothetical protein
MVRQGSLGRRCRAAAVTPGTFKTQQLHLWGQFETWREWYYPVVEVMPKRPISVEDTGGIARYVQREQASKYMRSSPILRGRSRSRRSPGTCGSQTPGALAAPSNGSSGAARGRAVRVPRRAGVIGAAARPRPAGGRRVWRSPARVLAADRGDAGMTRGPR